MLVKLSVENFKSFDKREELSMISSTKIRDLKDHQITIGHTTLLRNGVVYGANASGKSNLVNVFSFIKNVLLEGLSTNYSNCFCKTKKENKDRESFFELQFTIDDKFYAYGFTALLNQSTITEEWLYELKQNGSSHLVFSKERNSIPKLGDGLKISYSEKSRFNVYANDFRDDSFHLFLSEMNRGKKYNENGKLRVFYDVFNWIMNNIIVLNPNIGIPNTEMYYSDESLDNISRLIETFDTGVNNISIKDITVDEMSKTIPKEIINDMISKIVNQQQLSKSNSIQMTWRFDNGFYNIKLDNESNITISTLVLKHTNSVFDFDFAEESDGTKRLFDLIDMLLTDRPDTIFVVDELERSLHPKLTEHFLKLFTEVHKNVRMQLLFTTHEDTIMNQSLFRRDEIWFVERGFENHSNIYSLDLFKERYDKKLSKAYLEGRYGAIPIFRDFSFKKGE